MKARFYLAMALLLFGSVIVAFACWTDPSGELHTSIITFYGETLTAMLLLLGVKLKE